MSTIPNLVVNGDRRLPSRRGVPDTQYNLSPTRDRLSHTHSGTLAHPQSPLRSGSVLSLTHIAGVAQRVAAWLGPHGKPVRFPANRDAADFAQCGVNGVDLVIVATG